MGWKKAVALSGYGLVAVLVIVGIRSGQANLAVFALGGLLLALLAVDAWGVRRRIPLLNSTNKVAAASGWAIPTFLLVGVVWLTTAAIPTSTTPAAARNSSTPRPTVSATPTPTPSPPPVQPDGFVTLLNQASAHRGEYATLSVRTTPNTTCSITVTYKGRPSTAPGLETKTSDGTGFVSWTWKVGARTTLGQWPIAVSCGDGYAQTFLTVS